MRSKRINLQHSGTVFPGLIMDGIRLEIRKGEQVPMLHLVPLHNGKPLPGTIAIPALDLGELAQSIGAMDEELSRTPWDSINGGSQ